MHGLWGLGEGVQPALAMNAQPTHTVPTRPTCPRPQVVRYGLCTHDGSYTLDYYDEEIDVSHLGSTAEKVEYFEAHIIKKVRVGVSCFASRSGGKGMRDACT